MDIEAVAAGAAPTAWQSRVVPRKATWKQITDLAQIGQPPEAATAAAAAAAAARAPYAGVTRSPACVLTNTTNGSPCMSSSSIPHHSPEAASASAAALSRSAAQPSPKAAAAPNNNLHLLAGLSVCSPDVAGKRSRDDGDAEARSVAAVAPAAHGCVPFVRTGVTWSEARGKK